MPGTAQSRRPARADRRPPHQARQPRGAERRRGRAARPDPNKVYAVKTDGSLARGPANAPVTIIEFSDFQ
jgi:protein-disulfide isomerase